MLKKSKPQSMLRCEIGKVKKLWEEDFKEIRQEIEQLKSDFADLERRIKELKYGKHED